MLRELKNIRTQKNKTPKRMKFALFWPVFLVTAFVNFAVIFVNHKKTAGTFERCDLAASCTAERLYHLDNSWLCCEDGSGWPAAHILHPLAVALFSGSVSATVIAYFYFEAIEANFVTMLKTFVFVPADATQTETLAGAIVGDAQINGTLGLLLAVALAQFVDWRGFGHYWFNGRMENKVAAKYLLLYGVFAATFTLGGLQAGAWNYGVAISITVQLLLLLVVFPRCIGANDVVGFDLAASFNKVKWLWALAVVAIYSSGLGWHHFANDWYQAWLPTYILILFFAALAASRQAKRREHPVTKVNE